MGFLSDILSIPKKIVKGVGKAFTKVVKGIGKIVKGVAKGVSNLFGGDLGKALLIAGAIYFGGAGLGYWGGSGSSLPFVGEGSAWAGKFSNSFLGSEGSLGQLLGTAKNATAVAEGASSVVSSVPVGSETSIAGQASDMAYMEAINSGATEAGAMINSNNAFTTAGGVEQSVSFIDSFKDVATTAYDKTSEFMGWDKPMSEMTMGDYTKNKMAMGALEGMMTPTEAEEYAASQEAKKGSFEVGDMSGVLGTSSAPPSQRDPQQYAQSYQPGGPSPLLPQSSVAPTSLMKRHTGRYAPYDPYDRPTYGLLSRYSG